MSEMFNLFLPCPRGLEPALAAEMARLGSATLRVGNAVSSGVPARGSMADIMALNLHSRIASRVLLRLGQAPAAHADDVYRLALKLPWERWFTPQHTLRVDVTADRSPLQSLHFVVLRAKDGICDHFRVRGEERPDVEREQPDVRVQVHLDAVNATVYLDTSGEALFKRGWRAVHGEAPLKENLAAGLLGLSGWTPEAPLLDPMCGAGTIVIEAAQIACRIAPGMNRSFGFERLLGFDAAAWEAMREQARQQQRAAPAPIFASDIDPRLVQMTRQNAAQAGVEAALTLQQADVMDVRAPLELAPGHEAYLVTNPPYAERIEAKGSAGDTFLPCLGDVLKQRFVGWNAALLLADLHADRELRLKPARRHVVYNGPIECRLFTFALVAGRPPRRQDSAGA
jgi:putative N6-adenine-specific DNA methylase